MPLSPLFPFVLKRIAAGVIILFRSPPPSGQELLVWVTRNEDGTLHSWSSPVPPLPARTCTPPTGI